jgi:hypothetical protein
VQSAIRIRFGWPEDRLVGGLAIDAADVDEILGPGERPVEVDLVTLGHHGSREDRNQTAGGEHDEEVSGH